MARTLRRWLWLGLGLGVAACSRTPDSATATPTTRTGADKYVKRAIRQSNEGVILLPSERAERIYELPRLNEIAQALREPAALCFLERAIMTMERTGDERGYRDVPEGQIKIRARIAPNGQVLRTEVLETGFTDAKMAPCLEKAITRAKFPQNDGGVNHYIDVVYWVSLGLQSDVHTAEWKEHVKREQIGAGVRAKPCLEGRAPAGTYKVAALNLVDREGSTLINRIDGQGMPQELRSCVARAFRDIRLPRKPDAFVRPVWAEVEMHVRDDGGIEVAGEEWLRRVELEEQVKRRMKRQEMLGGDVGDGSRWTEDEGPIDEGEPVDDAASEDRPLADDRIPTTEPATPRDGASTPHTKGPDPGRGGIKIDLGTRPRAH
ncbi:MAG TPA: hypothetical protein VFG69_04235 [Nannocystaceae bacterium]|nr:hypothetical protein [Nannocystaceae bacterium]